MSDLYRVRTQLAGGSGASQVSTMFFSSAGSETAQDAATAVRTFWSGLADYISSAYTASVESDVFLIDQVTGEPTGIESVTVTPVACTQSSDALPWATQGLVRWTTGTFINGRQVRGRTFIPGPCESTNTAGVPTALYLSTVQSVAATFLSTTGVTPVIYSRKNHSGWPVLGRSTWNKWAELRSRRD